MTMDSVNILNHNLNTKKIYFDSRLVIILGIRYTMCTRRMKCTTQYTKTSTLNYLEKQVSSICPTGNGTRSLLTKSPSRLSHDWFIIYLCHFHSILTINSHGHIVNLSKFRIFMEITPKITMLNVSDSIS